MNIVEHVSLLHVGTSSGSMSRIGIAGSSGLMGWISRWGSLWMVFPSVSPLNFDVLTCNKDTCSTMFIAALLIITRSWKEPRCLSTEEWIQKMWYICTMEYYSAIKSNEFMKFLGKGMELENIILSEVTQ